MASEYAPIDISDAPGLLELAEEVRRTNKPRLLKRADEELAVIAPVRKQEVHSPLRRKSQADIDAFLSSAGGWREVDTDKRKEALYESRRISTKPRPEL